MKEGKLVIGGLRYLEIDFEVRNRLRELEVKNRLRELDEGQEAEGVLSYSSKMKEVNLKTQINLLGQ